MEDKLQYLSEQLAGNGTFINDQHRLFVIAPQKCGSTSILKALYDKLVEPSKAYEKDFSHEYTKELCIHKHLKKSQDCSPENLRRIFADQTYKKILVVRDSVDRLCSAICSKYLLENTIFYQKEIKEKRNIKTPLKQPYKNTTDFLDDFNNIANILLTKGAIFENETSSHSSPISDLIPQAILPFFNDIIDITNKDGWTLLKDSINQHLIKNGGREQIDYFPHVNENPLSKSRRFLSEQNLSIAYGRYSEDYLNLKINHPHTSEHRQEAPSQDELKALNTFIALATRSVDLFNVGKSRIESKVREKNKKQREQLSNAIIRNKQLIIREELSRKTAEQLLMESRDLKVLNHRLKTEISRIKGDDNQDLMTDSNNYFIPNAETSSLSSTQLAGRAEKRINNKNFKSAQELLLQAYCANKNNRYLLIRLFAVSFKNNIVRSFLLFITKKSDRQIKANSGVRK